ncbi:MAG: ribonuclease HI [Epsilonproteobacteria bacterium]|nr:ribonuclease HI [Campylobacterota bacterium]
MKQVTLFCDGSSLGNPGPGGYGAILRYGKFEKEFGGYEIETTNNRMELKAVIEGLKLLKEPCEVEIVSDSSYVVKAINEWLENWKKKEFKKVKNPDLWKEYVEVSKPHKITATWVRGHNGHTENERCDKIARTEAEKAKALRKKDA